MRFTQLDRLRKVMADKRITAKDLAAEMGCSHQWIGMIFDGTRAASENYSVEKMMQAVAKIEERRAANNGKNKI